MNDCFDLDSALVPDAHLELVADAVLNMRRFIDDGAHDEVLHLVSNERVHLQCQAPIEYEQSMLGHSNLGAVLVVLLAVSAYLTALLRVITDEFIQVIAQEQREYIAKLALQDADGLMLVHAAVLKVQHDLPQSRYLLLDVVLGCLCLSQRLHDIPA